MTSRTTTVGALVAFGALALGTALPRSASAIEPPVVDIVRTTADLVRVELLDGVPASGYNVYRGDVYVTTVRPPPEASAFPASVGARGGDYCVVAFDERETGTDYSACSAAVAVEAADPTMPDGEPPGPPTAPVNLRAIVYSAGVAELFWDAASDDGRVVAYRVTRDDVELAVANVRSLFQPDLDTATLYRYAVAAIDDEGNEGAAATLELRALVGDVPPPPPGEGEAPAPPTELRGVAYSPGVVEIFWDRSPDEGTLAGYAVARDGEPLALVRGRSVFEPDLVPGRLYTYEVAAVGADGARSAPLSLALRAGLPPPPDSGYVLWTNPEAITLREGDAAGVEIALSVQRADGERRPLTLSVLDARGAPLEELDARLEPASLGADDSESRLTLSLSVGMAPRLAEERELVVRIDDGASVVDSPLTVAIEPIDAPDVYLLIGQSNMEGYSEPGSKQPLPGQPDEPVERVQQLNVIENNPAFYPTPESYTDVAANVAEPLFIRAEDPLTNRLWPGRPAKSGDFIGPGLSFGKAALATTTRTVYLVPAPWGATGFCANANGERAWNAEPTTDPALGGTLLLDRALARLNLTLEESGGILRGILWHQGGADANDPRCAESYAENLIRMVRRLRGEALLDARGPAARGPEAPIPFVVATQSRGADERGDFSVYSASKTLVDQVHRDVAELIPFADVVINDDLVPPAYPCGQNSCVHFGAAALREQGARFHEALERIRAREAEPGGPAAP